MAKLTKHYKKMRLAYIASALAICLIVIFTYSYGEFTNRYNGYYVISLNGQELGSTKDPDLAEEVLKNARMRVMVESEELVYLESDLEIEEQTKKAHVIGDSEEMENLMYEVLVNSEASVVKQQQAYILNVNGYTVTLDSQEDVLEVLTEVKNEYDTEDTFDISLEESANGHFNTWTINIEKDEANEEETDTVDVAFEEDVEVIEAFVDESEIVDVEKAVELVTEDKPTETVYEVVSGDCLSTIAEDFDMSMSELIELNDYLTEDSVIYVEDDIVVTVPEPELSVVTVVEETYTEKYSAEIEYVETDKMYEGETKVVSKGSKGKRKVTAEVEYTNGEETNRTIVSEGVVKEAVAKVGKVGTLAKPTYIRPITGGTTSSYFGYRTAPKAGASTYHKGIDWAVPIGTSVKASCSGTVSYAGWSNGYGYNVVITHADGNQTRYAHLSSIVVSVGDKVTQGQKIALSGNSGNSTGPHLHFEVIVNGSQVNPLNYVSEY